MESHSCLFFFSPVLNQHHIYQIQGDKTHKMQRDFDSENEATEFPRFIALESLERKKKNPLQ